MSRMENDNFILSPEETKNLLNSLRKPKNEMIVKRDAFFGSIDSMDIVEKEDGTVLIEIPSLFPEDKKDLFALSANDKYCYALDVSVRVQYHDGENLKAIRDNNNYCPIQKDNKKFYEAIVLLAA